MSGNPDTILTQTTIGGVEAEVVVLPIGPVSIVYARNERGILACGAIDPGALQKFGIAAARVKPVGSPSIGSLADLLAGEVREANDEAAKRGVKVGMKGAEAFSKFA